MGFSDLIGQLNEAVVAEGHFLGHAAGGQAPKQGVLYMHLPGTDYECHDCNMWIPGKDRCTVHGEDDVTLATGSCGFFIKGKPMGGSPHGAVTFMQSGYVENPYGTGFSCKRCTFWESQKLGCTVVEPNSPGDDPGIIHGDACCNAWVINDEVAARD